MPKVVKNPNPGQVNPLFLGQTADHQNVEISDSSLIKNGLIIIGTKNSGKSSMIPNLFQQELIAPFEKDGKNYYPKTPASVIVITAKKDQSYILYAISRKRSIPAKAIHFLKPSANYAVKNKLMGMKEYKYDAVNSIINFTDVIKNKETVLIDMETERYGEASVQAVGMLLMQLQIAMHNTAETGKRRCYLIIDDAAQYLPYLDNFLIYGSEYNLSTILVFSSRRQYSAYTSLVEDNLQNYLLMPNLTYDDAVFFAQKYFLDSPRDLIGQGGRNCFLAAYDDSMALHTSRIALEYLLYSDHQDDLMRESAKKYKQSLDQSGSDEEYIATIMKAYAYYTVQQHQKFKPGTATEAVAEMLESGRDKKITVESVTPGTPTFINRFKPQQISASNVGPTVKAQDSVRGAGMQALLGAVHNSPDRIKEKLEKEGLTEETIKATMPSLQSKPNAGSAGGRPKEQPKQNNGKPNQNKPRQNTAEQNKPKQNKTPENPYAAQLDAGSKTHEKDTGNNHPQPNKNHNEPGKNGNHNETGKNGHGKGNNHKKGENQDKKQQNQNQNKGQKHAETKPARQNDAAQRTARPNDTKAQKPDTQAAPKQENRKEAPQTQEKPAEAAQNTVSKPEDQTTETLYELKPKDGTEQEVATDSKSTQADSATPATQASPKEFVADAPGVNKESDNLETDDAENDVDTSESDDSVQPGLQFDLSSTTDEEEEDSDSGEYTLDLHSYMADISDIPKSADAEFDAQTKKFLKILQNQTSRPSFFAQNKEIAEAEKRFGKH